MERELVAQIERLDRKHSTRIDAVEHDKLAKYHEYLAVVDVHDDNINILADKLEYVWDKLREDGILPDKGLRFTLDPQYSHRLD